MEYKVVLTSEAKTQFRKIIYYLLHELESPQAATNVADDFDETVDRLSSVAGSLKICDDEVLRAKEYRTIHFRRHKYLMIYSIHAQFLSFRLMLSDYYFHPKYNFLIF